MDGATAPESLDFHDIVELPLVRATPEALSGYGCLVDGTDDTQIEIVTWPAPGWRPVDPGTGNEGGVAEGVFEFWWAGDAFYGRNRAVDDSYLLGWSRPPEEASDAATDAAPQGERERLLIWHANYHPDGGQLFFPHEAVPFVAPLAPPGDDVKPRDFVAFYCDGTQGLYIHPGVWHEAVVPLAETASFDDKQGKVHARISVNFMEEFGALLSVPLRRPDDAPA
jgi:ureidoglycolate lyase